MEQKEPPSDRLREALPILEALIRAKARGARLDPDEEDEFGSFVHQRILANDEAILRKFRDDSSLGTYLSAVVGRLWLDFLIQKRGKWRPSSTAVALGEVAEALERLLHRCGCTPREAFERLRSKGLTQASDLELARLAAQLPDRPPLRPEEVPLDSTDLLPAEEWADHGVEEAERRRRWEPVRALLREVLGTLTPEDRLLIQMRCIDKKKISFTARALGLEQKPLYRRVERVVVDFRKALEERGLGEDEVRRLLQEGAPDDDE
jgi:RNA polymerase sigma factor (sigma-70 family)